MSVNQKSSLCDFALEREAFDNNLSDDQKLVLSVTSESSYGIHNHDEKIKANVTRTLLTGQYSPIDNDSGTCSDVEVQFPLSANSHQPPKLPTKLKEMDQQKCHILSDSFCSDASSASSSDSIQYSLDFHSNLSPVYCRDNLLSPSLVNDFSKKDQSELVSIKNDLLLSIRNLTVKYSESQCESSDDADDYEEVCKEQKYDSIKCYSDDKFYKFHVNEHFDNSLESHDVMTHDESDESFAGFKDLTSGTATIRSGKGTIRGVKNRVRNGIATFLQIQQEAVKNFKDKDGGKIVMYTTSMGIVRSTFAKCQTIKKILRTLMVKFEERDVFMSHAHQDDIRKRMMTAYIDVPQLFIDGQYIGNADQVERLNEVGELRKMVKPYKCIDSIRTCNTCGGYRYVPCSICGGSKRSIHRNHFTAEFIALKCMNCDEVGLVKCSTCS